MPPAIRAVFATEFAKDFNSHIAKSAFALFGERVFMSPEAPPSWETLLAEVNETAALTHAAKMRGMYVDVDEDGTVHEPDQTNPADAESMVRLLDRMLKEQQALRMFGLIEPADILGLYEQLWNSDFASSLEHRASADPDTFVAEVRAAVRGEAEMPAWVLEIFSDTPLEHGTTINSTGVVAESMPELDGYDHAEQRRSSLL